MNTQQKQWKFQSIIGELFLVASEDGLERICWEEQKGIPFAENLQSDSKAIKILHQSVSEISDFLSGKREKFSVPLLLKGTPFQVKVWQALMQIPFGETISYSELATRIKSAATRAVGSANGKNPLCLIVPCHRVISKNGSLGGYSGSLQVKRKLLSIEGLSLSL